MKDQTGALLSEDSWFDESCFHANLGYLWNCDVTGLSESLSVPSDVIVVLVGCWSKNMGFHVHDLSRSQPPDYILRNAKYTKKYYRLTSAAPYSGQDCTNGQPSAFELLTPDENEAVSFFNIYTHLFLLFPLCLTSSCFQ